MVPQSIQDYMQEDITYTIVGDRESDIFEFMLIRKKNLELIANC